MKKILFIICSLVIYLICFSQTKTHEFYVTAGIGSGPFIVESFNNNAFDFSGIFGSDPQSNETHKDQVLPVLTIGYQYPVSKKIKLGPEVIFDRCWIDNKKNSYHFNSFLCRLSYIWLNKRKITMYAGASAGITFKNSTETINGGLNNSKKIYP